MYDGRFTYSANISILFPEVPFLERPGAARAAGFAHVESWWPFTTPTADEQQIADFVKALAEADVSLSALNFFAGDMAAGERGLACRPDRQNELDDNVPALLRIAEQTGCRFFNLLYGQLDDRWERSEQTDTAVNAIRRLAAELEVLDGTVLLEPLASGLNGHYPLTTGYDVAELLTGPLSSSPNVALLFDVFHLGSNDVNTVEAAEQLADSIGHVQLADAPGRGEPGSGQLPIMETLDALYNAGYRGMIGCEYKPTRRTIDTLEWVRQAAS